MDERILIIDDEDDSLFVFSRLLERLDCVVDTARTLAEARRAMRDHCYDVIVTDLRLSGTLSEEGLDILRAAQVEGYGNRVIVVTGYGSPSVMTKAYELGAAYYFEKPVQPARLLDAVSALCQDVQEVQACPV